MVADIHAFVEGITPDGFATHLASVYIERSYVLFGLLAGVRREDLCLYPPRGIPPTLSWPVAEQYYLRVIDSLTYVERELSGEIKIYANEITAAEAEHLTSTGICHYKPETDGFNKNYISAPDWHTPSYLMLQELRKVNHAYRRYHTDTPIHMQHFSKSKDMRKSDSDVNIGISYKLPTFEAVLSYMARLKKFMGTYDVRLVFWFDN